jgi:diguanylate cyclase (GGDEF)-like protein
MSRAEAQALATGEPAEVVAGAGAALARPLQGREGTTMAVVTIARSRAAFTAEEHDLLAYLSGQGAASIENVMLHERAEHQAATDALTGLANRRQFEERLLAEVDRTRRFPAPLGLMMLDIDHFKQVNDRFGHQAGDDVLRAVAGAVSDCARDVDVAARYGGEEMAVLLPGADVAGALAAAERVRKAVEALDTGILDAEGEPVRVTVSLGVASLGEGPTDGDDLVAQADAALYRAKHAGRNRSEAAAPAAVR